MSHGWSLGRVLGPPSSPTSWDSKAFGGAVVVPSSSSPFFRMYYYGRSADQWNMGVQPFNPFLPTGRIGMATSQDGSRFDRFPGPLHGGALLDPSDNPSSFDCVHIAVGDVVPSPHHGGQLYLYYFAGGLDEVPLVGIPGKTAKGARFQPGMALSDDGGITFRRTNGPILTVGTPGEWDENGVSWPRVLPPWNHSSEAPSPLANKWLMSYHTREGGGYNGMGFFSAGVAVSDDGKNWEKMGKVVSCGQPGSWDEGGVSVRHVVYNNGQYLMFYEGSDYRFDFAIGLAISEDGINWKKDERCGPEPGGPILRARKGENFWDNSIVGTPYVLAMPDGSFRMYYLGVGKEGETTAQGIGLAVSDGPNFRLWRRYGE